MEIVPAILTDRLELLQSTLKIAGSFTDYVQIDFMDGVFVPSRSVSPRELSHTSTSLVCEAHLMVEEPEIYLKDLKRFGFRPIPIESIVRPCEGENLVVRNLDIPVCLELDRVVHFRSGSDGTRFSHSRRIVVLTV